MGNRQFWLKVLELLRQEKSLFCLIVVHSEGSSPGRAGFKIAVSNTNQMIGSIGGGMMEHKLVEWSKALLTNPPAKPFIKRQVHKADASSKSGMICSGSQTIAFYHIQETDYSKIQSGMAAHSHVLWSEDGFEFYTPSANEDSPRGQFCNEGIWSFSEPLLYKDSLYIVGAGHVGTALSSIAQLLPFEVYLLDDRTDLNTLVLNSFVAEHRKKVISYENIDQHIPEGDHTYVAVVSFSFRTDEMIIRKLIYKNYKYFGVMGSYEKMRQLLDNLRLDGVGEDLISRIHTPIGIPIGSQTPHEIAVSIAAQLIQYKNSQP